MLLSFLRHKGAYAPYAKATRSRVSTVNKPYSRLGGKPLFFPIQPPHGRRELFQDKCEPEQVGEGSVVKGAVAGRTQLLRPCGS